MRLLGGASSHSVTAQGDAFLYQLRGSADVVSGVGDGRACMQVLCVCVCVCVCACVRALVCSRAPCHESAHQRTCGPVSLPAAAWAAWIAHALTAESLLSGQVAEGMCLTVVGPDQVEVKGAAGGVTLVISQLKA